MAKKKKSDNDLYNNTFLFEIAWEVCNQVGGIYTVIRSKIPSIVDKWNKENYILLGPYFESEASPVFEPITDLTDPIGFVTHIMRESGYDVHYGHWLVSGKPKMVLFNPFTVFDKLGEIKYELWENHAIPTPAEDDLMNQVVSFGFQVKEFLKLLVNSDVQPSNIIAHFHEWMSAIPIPGLRKEQLPIKIVFTTHATLLGRYLAMNDNQFYDHLAFYNWEDEAKKFNVESIVAIERAAAHGAHILSTVSEITANECTHLLGRTPDVILPNGLNIERFEALHQFQNLHLKYKEQIHEFVMGHFFQSYSFDLNKTFYFFTSGRFEYHNKGYDLTLEALARLNWKMQQEKIDATVVFFLITKRPYHTLNANALQSKALMEEIRRNCEEIEKQVGEKLFYEITAKNDNYKLPNLNDLIEEHSRLKLRRTVQTWKTYNLPSIVTHDLIDDASDEVLSFLRLAKLVNNKEDKVKIVYHPDFINSANPLFHMDYNQFVRGCHLGVFPSYYEPWGYTPLECMASGVPSITSNLAGFGSYVSNQMDDNYKDLGIFLVDRRYKSFHDSAEELANQMLDFTKLSRRSRINLRNKVESSSTHFDWKNLGAHYFDAYKKAMKKI